ncbi:MAG: hypothetical protein J6T99_06190 [Oscillospiraceae bacterium]|nr:hypothetical protein [Oscillospiraceae bacterium]
MNKEQEAGRTASFLSRSALIWKLRNYSAAYLTRPKKDWGAYEFVYRSTMRSLVDDLIRRMCYENRPAEAIVEDLHKRADEACEEPDGEVYRLYRDALEHVEDIVIYLQKEEA